MMHKDDGDGESIDDDEVHGAAGHVQKHSPRR